MGFEEFLRRKDVFFCLYSFMLLLLFPLSVAFREDGWLKLQEAYDVESLVCLGLFLALPFPVYVYFVFLKYFYSYDKEKRERTWNF